MKNLLKLGALALWVAVISTSLSRVEAATGVDLDLTIETWTCTLAIDNAFVIPTFSASFSAQSGEDSSSNGAFTVTDYIWHDSFTWTIDVTKTLTEPAFSNTIPEWNIRFHTAYYSSQWNTWNLTLETTSYTAFPWPLNMLTLASNANALFEYKFDIYFEVTADANQAPWLYDADLEVSSTALENDCTF